MKQKIRQSGNAWGAHEAKLAIASLGNLITHDQAVACVNGVIDHRSSELRVDDQASSSVPNGIGKKPGLCLQDESRFEVI
jgi:hypothetical protein